ncbi:MAG: hypothetical protein GF317_24165 [Candidatus Lokiarchaeota archaeon]|nr:hypothetical protein [Candidatus Lokiarchaeota archaeon]MBD3202469.1 hypothetical protein [Candidatus Lokiarchaeota archaeon]
MTWVPLLLTDSSPCLRLKVLTNLLNKKSDDTEVMELKKLRKEDPLYKNTIHFQNSDGSWNINTSFGYKTSDRIQTTSLELIRLGYIGFTKENSHILNGINYLLSQQNDDGSWPIQYTKSLTPEEEQYEMMPIQTALPIFALLICDYQQDKRINKAFRWLLKNRLDDGAWPVGVNSGVYGGIAGYRRLSHSKWGCRASTTAVLNCFAYHPEWRRSLEAQRALDLILGTDIKSRKNLGFVVARRIGLESSYGRITYFAKFDLAHILDLVWRVGASVEDKRILEIINYLRKIQGEYGLWEYKNDPKGTRWITYDILRSLSCLDDSSNWISLEPQTPFEAYPRKEKRY